jgi:hypothetical protein
MHYISLARRKKSWYVITHESKTLFPLSWFIMGIFLTIYGILKVTYPNGEQPLVGRDQSISFMVLILTGFIFIGLVLYLHVIIQFLQSYSNMMTTERAEILLKRLDLLGVYSWFIIPVAFMVGSLPLIAIAYPNKSKELCMAYLLGLGSTAVVFDLMCCSCLSVLIKDLKVYIESIEPHLSNEIKLVVRRLNFAWISLFLTGVVFGILNISFVTSNLLFHSSTYYLLFSWICLPPSLYIIIITVSRVSLSDNDKIVPVSTEKKAPVISDKTPVSVSLNTDTVTLQAASRDGKLNLTRHNLRKHSRETAGNIVVC